MSKYTTEEGIFFVEIITPTQEQLKEYYTKNEEIEVSHSSPKAPRPFQKAIIKHTFDEDKYPIDSEWIMGESPGIKINFFGEKLIQIQTKDLYARIN